MVGKNKFDEDGQIASVFKLLLILCYWVNGVAWNTGVLMTSGIVTLSYSYKFRLVVHFT